jgi:hypothetical protein
MANSGTYNRTKVHWAEGAAAATPDAGEVVVYAKADGLMYSKDDAGAETLMSGGSAGAVATDAIWDAKGDLAGGTGANTAARLAVGANDTVLTADSAEATGLKWAAAGAAAFVGCKVYHAATESVGAGAALVPLFDSEEEDTDLFHYTSAANLTGTVSKTASSPNIVGVGTAFLTELGVNQVISIPGTAAEIGVVKTITDDENIILWQNMANNASGQTATRKSSHFAVPAGKAGKYRANYATFIDGYTGSAQSLMSWRVNDAFPRGGELRLSVVGSSFLASPAPIFVLAEGDFLYAVIINGSTATQVFGHASALQQQTTFMLEYLGA